MEAGVQSATLGTNKLYSAAKQMVWVRATQCKAVTLGHDHLRASSADFLDAVVRHLFEDLFHVGQPKLAVVWGCLTASR